MNDRRIRDDRFLAVPGEFLPACLTLLGGDSWAYNRTNYVLLGEVIERVSGMRFEEFVRPRILVPAGMDSTVYGTSWTWCPGRATSYETEGGRLRHRSSLVFPRYVRMVAGLNSNAPDMVRWIRAVTKGERSRRPAAGDVDRSPVEGTRGYGIRWIVDDRAGHRLVDADPDALIDGIARILLPDLSR